MSFPGVTETGGGFALRSGEAYGFPRNLLAILGRGSPWIELGRDGVKVDGEASTWATFNTVCLTGGPEEPEVIELVGDASVVVLRTEAVPEGPQWTTAALRDFASRIAALAGLPLFDELASDQAWIDAASEQFYAMVDRNIDRNPGLHAKQEAPETVADLDGLRIRLQPDPRYHTQSLVLTLDANRIHKGRRSLELADIDACRVTYRRHTVRSTERGIRIKVAGRVVAGPPEWYDTHEATIWALCGTARQVIGRVVVSDEEGVSPAQVNWTAARILAAAAQAKTRDRGSEEDVPEALEGLRDAD